MKRISTALCLSLLVPFLLHSSSNPLQQATPSKHKKALPMSLTPHLNTASTKPHITPTSKPTTQKAISTPSKLTTQPSIGLINDPLLPAASTQFPLPTEAPSIHASAITLSEAKTPEEPSEPIVATQAESVTVQTSLEPTLPQRTFKFTIDENDEPYIGTEYWETKKASQTFSNGAIKPTPRFNTSDNEGITEKATLLLATWDRAIEYDKQRYPKSFARNSSEFYTEKATLLLATWDRASEYDKQRYPKSFARDSSEFYNECMNQKDFEACPEDEKKSWKPKNFSLHSLASALEEFTHESYTSLTLPQPPKLVFESSESTPSITEEIIDLIEYQLNSTERSYIEELYAILHSEQKELTSSIPQPERWTANLRNALEKIRGGDTAKTDYVSRLYSWIKDQETATKKHKKLFLETASQSTAALYSKYLELMNKQPQSRNQQDTPELRDTRKKLAQLSGFNLSAKMYEHRRQLAIVDQHEKAKKALE